MEESIKLLFKTEAEQKRVRLLLNLAKKFVKVEEFSIILPNMVKDPEGKISITGFFLLSDTIILEFRDYLTSIDFDYAKYDYITNIRINMKSFTDDGLPKEDSNLEIKFSHTSITGFHTEITVFGENECNYVIEKVKNLNKYLK